MGATKPTRDFSIRRGIHKKPQKVGVYGPPGCGKSSLAADLKKAGINPLIIDVGDGTDYLDVDRIPGLGTWQDIRAVLHDRSIWGPYGAVVIDDMTTAEQLAIKWTLENVTTEKGQTVNSIEKYGWGKGYVHSYETFLQLFGDLDMHVRDGRMVVCIAHEQASKVPNPKGEDWLRYEPRLQNADKGNIRKRFVEWVDHLLFIGYDVNVTENGQGIGTGSRAIYTTETATQLAKNHDLGINELVYPKGSSEIWTLILKGQQ